MGINIRIKKRHVYLLSALIILGFSLLFVQGQGMGIPNPGHDSDSILVNVGGAQKTLQNAIDQGDIVLASALPQNLGEPDYDSGWVADSYSPSHQTTFNHNLGVVPRQISIWFGSVENPTVVYQVLWPWADSVSGNPVTIELTTSNIIFNIYSGRVLHAGWRPGSGWDSFTTGYWRVFAWR